jgi:hypothetical protein
MYAGIPNLFQISVTGIKNKDIRPILSEGVVLHKYTENNYGVSFDSKIKEVEIGAEVLIDGVYKPLKGYRPTFQIKQLPDPQLKILGQTSNGTITKEILNNSLGVTAIIENDMPFLRVRVISFELSVLKKGSLNSVISFDGKFNEHQLELIKTIDSNEKLIIDDIKVIMPDGTNRTLAPLVLTVKN